MSGGCAGAPARDRAAWATQLGQDARRGNGGRVLGCASASAGPSGWAGEAAQCALGRERDGLPSRAGRGAGVARGGRWAARLGGAEWASGKRWCGARWAGAWGLEWARRGAKSSWASACWAGRKRAQAGQGGWEGFPFPIYSSFSYSFIYLYSNLDIVFESQIQIYSLSLNGCTTTTIQHIIKYLGMLCKNQGLFLGFHFTTLNICICVYTHSHTK
jgi:hypothetical protein